MTKNKKLLYGVLIIILVAVVIGLYFYSIFPDQKVKTIKESKKTIPQTKTKEVRGKTQLPNPASVYCVKNGGKLKIRKDKKGNEYGFCIFNDGSECGQWAFFRGECKKGKRFCKDLCGDGVCQEMVCQTIG